MLSSSLHVLSLNDFLNRDNFAMSTCGKHSHILSSATFNTKLFLDSDETYKKLRALLPRHDVSRTFKSGELSWMAIDKSQSFADSSHAGIVERHMLCAQSHMHLAESAALAGSRRLHSSANFGNRNNKTTSTTVCKNITAKITSQYHHCHVKLVSVFVDINENYLSENYMLKNVQIYVSINVQHSCKILLRYQLQSLTSYQQEIIRLLYGTPWTLSLNIKHHKELLAYSLLVYTTIEHVACSI